MINSHLHPFHLSDVSPVVGAIQNTQKKCSMMPVKNGCWSGATNTYLKYKYKIQSVVMPALGGEWVRWMAEITVCGCKSGREERLDLPTTQLVSIFEDSQL